jgi:glycogen operon protein
VTAHDGFTLQDLVSYDHKHNEANLEGNASGEDHNRSWNCGIEGPTGDPGVLARRARQKRNFLATLFLSQGVPMLLHGDERGRTQDGNNNAYAQDNDLSWMDWEHPDEDLLDFTRRLIRLRRKHPVFRRRRWFQGQPIRGIGVNDIGWFTPDGVAMSEDHWTTSYAKSLSVFLNGLGIRTPDPRGNPVKDRSFLLLFNAHHEALPFTIPESDLFVRWSRVLDTAGDAPGEEVLTAGGEIVVQGRSLVVLRHVS